MEKIEEALFSKEFFIKSKDPLSVAIHILEIISSFGIVNERRNVYETDGPRKRLIMEYDIINHIDKNSETILSFLFSGEWNSEGFLKVVMNGMSRIKTAKTAGFFSENFSDFYLNELLPDRMGHEKKKLENMADGIENKLRKEKIVVE